HRARDRFDVDGNVQEPGLRRLRQRQVRRLGSRPDHPDAARSRLVLETKLSLTLLVTAAAGPRTRPLSFRTRGQLRRRWQSVRFACRHRECGQYSFFDMFNCVAPVARSTIDETTPPDVASTPKQVRGRSARAE